jgi:hypothetical protein
VWVLILGMTELTTLAGCGGAGDELPREAVSGTVNLNGAPLKAGMIQFQPSDPTAATAGAAGITDGRYSIAKAEGLVPGKYLVSITSTPPASSPTPVVMPGDPVGPPKEPIPAQYNAKSNLTAQVTKGGPNEFEFSLKSK